MYNIHSFPVDSSVITAVAKVISPNVTIPLYNITVTCTVHPNSTADQCVVMAIADNRVTRIGMCIYRVSMVATSSVLLI